MISVETHDDVTRFELSGWQSRLIGYSVSAYLVRGVLVDIGFPHAAPEVERLLRERRPQGVLVTHKHEDHAGNVALAIRLGVPVGASAETLAALRAPAPIGFYRRYTWGVPSPLGAREISPFEHEALALVPTPGHSRDHHVVWDAERRTLFGGDLFLGVRVRIAHPGEEPRRLLESLRMAAALEPLRLFDAHRGLVRDPAPLLRAKADWIEETIAAVERRIAEGWSDRAIRRDVLGGEGLAGYFSAGDYSRGNFVRAVRATATGIAHGEG